MPARDQHTLPLHFEEPCDKDQLASRLTHRIGKDVHLTLTRNRVSMVHFRHEAKQVRIRLHRNMCHMPDEVLNSLAGWIRKPGKSGAPDLVRTYIRSLPAEEQPTRRRRPAQLVQQGDVHDLGSIAQRVNQEQFNGSVTAGVSWGRDTSRTPVRVRRIGSYHRDSNTITIHPVLDDVRVPEAIVAFTIFHEMLHALQPATQKRHHDKAFRQAEQAHPDYDSVQRWMKKHSRLMNGGHGRKLS
ncbi:M48 family metallopeptidase [bacterium]|nr:M48 family metallopeptidase [bacterium]